MVVIGGISPRFGTVPETLPKLGDSTCLTIVEPAPMTLAKGHQVAMLTIYLVSACQALPLWLRASSQLVPALP